LSICVRTRDFLSPCRGAATGGWNDQNLHCSGVIGRASSGVNGRSSVHFDGLAEASAIDPFADGDFGFGERLAGSGRGIVEFDTRRMRRSLGEAFDYHRTGAAAFEHFGHRVELSPATDAPAWHWVQRDLKSGWRSFSKRAVCSLAPDGASEAPSGDPGLDDFEAESGIFWP
jgi:hypothetical protein